jgi:undecaprenyl pyrophosphate synthase
MTHAITQYQWDAARFGTADSPKTLEQANDRITFAMMVESLREAKEEVKALKKLLEERNTEVMSYSLSNWVVGAVGAAEESNKALRDGIKPIKENAL